MARLGNFWKFLATNSITKVAPKYIWLLGYFEKDQKGKNCCGYYLDNFWKLLGNIFFSAASGHTGRLINCGVNATLGWIRDTELWLATILVQKSYSIFLAAMHSWADRIFAADCDESDWAFRMSGYSASLRPVWPDG